MRIAFDIRGLDGTRGGKGVWTTSVLKSLVSLDHEDEFWLYSNQNPGGEFATYPNVHVVRVGGRSLIWHWNFYTALLRDRIDVLVASESYVVPFLHDPKKLKVALVVHDLVVFKSPAKHQGWATLIERLTLRKAAQKSRWILTVSEHTKKDLIGQYPALDLGKKTTVVHAGVRELFGRRADANQLVNTQRKHQLDPDYLLMVGTLEPRKNILGAIDAYRLLDPKHQKRYRLVVIGRRGWYYEEIFAKVKGYGLEDRVRFLESVPTDELVVLMQGARVFLFPSFYEGFGLPVLEAMLAGVPVVATNATSVPEVCGTACHLIDPNNPTDLANGITKVLEDEVYRQQLIDRGLEQVRNFSWERTAGKMLEVVRNHS